MHELSPVYDPHLPPHSEQWSPSEKLFHLSQPVSAAAIPLGSVLLLSRWVFSAQDGPRYKLKRCPEPLAISFLEYVLKNSVDCL